MRRTVEWRERGEEVRGRVKGLGARERVRVRSQGGALMRADDKGERTKHTSGSAISTPHSAPPRIDRYMDPGTEKVWRLRGKGCQWSARAHEHRLKEKCREAHKR